MKDLTEALLILLNEEIITKEEMKLWFIAYAKEHLVVSLPMKEAKEGENES